jgi:preprotein translocase subunit SecG
MQQVVLGIHILVCFAIVVLVLLQHGKGADAGATFGGGQSSNTMFGSQGALPFLMKLTVVCATLFFASSLLLTYLPAHQKPQLDPRLPTVKQVSLPATALPDIGQKLVKKKLPKDTHG